MTAMDDREKAFENKFAHDEELRFKAASRRNRLLGLWAAEQLGKTDAEAQEYAQSVVVSDFEKPGDADVLEKVLRDLVAGGITTDAAHVRKKMDQLMAEAQQQVLAE